MESQKWARVAEIEAYKVIERDKAEKQNQQEGRRAKWKRIYRVCNCATITVILFLAYAGTKGN